jgi:hypothetical protein
MGVGVFITEPRLHSYRTVASIPNDKYTSFRLTIDGHRARPRRVTMYYRSIVGTSCESGRVVVEVRLRGLGVMCGDGRQKTSHDRLRALHPLCR